MDEVNLYKKSVRGRIFSQVGFCLAIILIVLLIILWFVAKKEIADPSPFSHVGLVFPYVGICLGGSICGVVFSIIGLVKQIRHKHSKFFGVNAFVLNVTIFILILFFPVLGATFLVPEPSKVTMPEQSTRMVESIDEDKDAIEIIVETDKVVLIDHCDVDTFGLVVDENLEKDMSGWLVKKNFPDTVNVYVNASAQVPYIVMNRIFDILQTNNLKKFSLKTSLRQE
ncbi:MAG: biopolymer transporter ExbD [Bacteroidales bacterium]|nr:biopolymer transporter ExbD [Bacteroidales bacterium]